MDSKRRAFAMMVAAMAIRRVRRTATAAATPPMHANASVVRRPLDAQPMPRNCSKANRAA